MLALIAAAGCMGNRHPEAEGAALPAAKAWLGLVDTGQYAESWDDAASYFKGAVPKEQWVKTMQAARQPFGANLSREVRSSRYHTALPGAPDGEYVVFQFKTSFENKKKAIETVTPMKDSDGTWRVSGYYMK
jgi:hypothetical protein